jgi:predicted metalloendopeptidase
LTRRSRASGSVTKLLAALGVAPACAVVPGAGAARSATAAAQEFTREQRFFVAFAHAWAGAVRPEQARELVTIDPHPPAEYRTNATLANSAAFQAAFDLSPPSPMVKQPRCVIW